MDGGEGLTATAAPPRLPPGPETKARATSRFLYRHAGVRLAGLLSLPLAWLVVAYLGALGTMLIAAFWTTDDFTGDVVRTTSLHNFSALLGEGVYRTIALRSLLVAVLVTLIDAVIALPIAYFMAKVAGTRAQRLLVIAVLMPLWASYLVKTYAWRVMFARGGVLDWALDPVGLHGPGYGLSAVVVTQAY
ncbi:MAG: ABC transporter permease, partial [Blastococcus sp.]